MRLRVHPRPACDAATKCSREHVPWLRWEPCAPNAAAPASLHARRPPPTQRCHLPPAPSRSPPQPLRAAHRRPLHAAHRCPAHRRSPTDTIVVTAASSTVQTTRPWSTPTSTAASVRTPFPPHRGWPSAPPAPCHCGYHKPRGHAGLPMCSARAHLGVLAPTWERHQWRATRCTVF